MNDLVFRRRLRDGSATERDLARMGMGRVVLWNGNSNGDGDGNGNGYGHGNSDGDGDGNGNGYGHGNSDGDGDGDGDGYGDGYGHGNSNGDDGNSDGNGYGHGDGDGNGDGFGYGYGYGNSNNKEELVKHTEYLSVGTPVVVRSYVSGVIVGKLAGGDNGSVALTNWRWLRRWEGVGNEGSVYDLVHSDKSPVRVGPLTESLAIFQQADLMQIDERAYTRLAEGELFNS